MFSRGYQSKRVNPPYWSPNFKGNPSKVIFRHCTQSFRGYYSRVVWTALVQSLNSHFFPPHIGAEPGRAKEESRSQSRITCMRMLRTPPFFPPKSGEKPYLEVFSRFGLWRDFLNNNTQATISAFRLIKNLSINPKSVEFHQCHAKPHSMLFFILTSKRTKVIFAKIC